MAGGGRSGGGGADARKIAGLAARGARLFCRHHTCDRMFRKATSNLQTVIVKIDYEKVSIQVPEKGKKSNDLLTIHFESVALDSLLGQTKQIDQQMPKKQIEQIAKTKKDSFCHANRQRLIKQIQYHKDPSAFRGSKMPKRMPYANENSDVLSVFRHFFFYVCRETLSFDIVMSHPFCFDLSTKRPTSHTHFAQRTSALRTRAKRSVGSKRRRRE